MSDPIAHELNAKWRSNDVITNEQNNFASFHLDERILAGLSKAGYRIPSPVQLEAIPLCLTGSDVFVQGKAGTGKTLVFSILALTTVLEAKDLQVLIVAPTREGAFQIYSTINAIGCEVKDLKCECFIGGFSFAEDIPKAENCNIAVGTAGRISHLIHEEKLQIDNIRLFVIDDVDELLNKYMRPEVTDIFDTLPVRIQTVVTSLTCTDEVVQLASEYLKQPCLACYCEKELPPLLGMAHYYQIVPFDSLPVLAYRKKLAFLKDVLLKVKFSQCIVFCNSVYKVELLCTDVQDCGLSVLSMTKAMDQAERLQALELLKKNKCKVFVTTDVSSRGIDAENVDLVVNFDMPTDSRIYLHRCGRAGRYGGKCSSVTFLSESQKNLLVELENEEHFKSYALPEPIPEDLNFDTNPSKVTSLPCKPPSSESNIGENNVTSLIELSKNAVSNLEKTKAGESCLLLTANKTEEQVANLEIADTNHLMPDLAIVQLENGLAEDCQDTAKIKSPKTCLLLSGEEKAEIPSNGETFSANQLSRDFEDTEAFKSEHDIKNCEESSHKSAHTPSRKEATLECAKGNVLSFSDSLSSASKPLPRLNNCKNLKSAIGEGRASEIKTKKYLKKTDTGNECSSCEERDLFSASTTVPKTILKIKSTSKTSKDVSQKAFHEVQLKKENRHQKFARIPHLTQEKKTCDKSFGNSKMPSSLACERQVMFCGSKTSSESDPDQPCKKFYSGCPANHSDKKTVCMKHNMQTKCGKCLHGYVNHSHTYFNDQRNSFPGRKVLVNRQRSCCNSSSCCPSSQCSSFPDYNYQHHFLMHRDMFYKQLKFINDFSYFLSNIHNSLS